MFMSKGCFGPRMIKIWNYGTLVGMNWNAEYNLIVMKWEITKVTCQIGHEYVHLGWCGT